MWEITFAFLVAIAICFVFKQTRWLGVLGVFLLICINPFLFVALLVLCCTVGYWIRAKKRYQDIRRLFSDWDIRP